MTVDERMDRLTAVVESLAASVVAHDSQLEGQAHNSEAQARNIEAQAQNIDALILVAEKHEAAIANLEKQWQAYLNTIHPKQ